jgi:hypothetical protein
MTLHVKLNKQIPAKLAIGIVTMQAAAHMIITFRAVNKMSAIIASQRQDLHILSETTSFLLDRADDATLSGLDENLEFWRTIRKMNS